MKLVENDYHSTVPVNTCMHPIGLQGWWMFTLGAVNQQREGVFSEVRILGASRKRGVRFCPPCHSPGFIGRKSGNGDDIPAPSKDPDGSREQTKSHSHRGDVSWRCSGCYLTLCPKIASSELCFACGYPNNREFCSSKAQWWVKSCLWK